MRRALLGDFLLRFQRAADGKTKEQMASQIFLFGLATNTLVLNLLLNILVLKNEAVLAQLSINPLWNVSSNQTDHDACHLYIDTVRQEDVIEFAGSPSQACSVQLETSNGTAALIYIPGNLSVYAERQSKVLNCQKRYVSFQSDEPCFVVFQHPQVQLFLEACDHYNNSIIISELPLNDSASICPKYSSDEEQHDSEVSRIAHCYSEDSDELFSCQLSPDYTCSVKFPANCNVVLGKRFVQFHCSGDDLLNKDRDALIVYPTGIITLDLTKQGIIEIKSSFLNLKSLKRLILDKNKLTTLNPNLFNGLKWLRELSIQKNELKDLQRRIFSDLVDLNELDLARNNLDNLDKTVFTNLRNLTKLYLNINHLTILPTELFRGMINLEYLNLRGNRLVLLQDNAFRENIKLANLILQNNALLSLPESIFTTTKLIHLNLRHNKLEKLPKHLLRGQHMINIVNFYGNLLQSLPNDLFWGLLNVEILQLSYNEITYLNEQIFNGLESLRVLYFAHNQLKTLNSKIFQNTKNLSVLDLSWNRLTNIPNIFYLNRLIFLNLQNNKLTRTSRNSLTNLSKSTELYVSQHEICDCYVPNGTNCIAGREKSPFMTCDRLLSDRVLLFMMWLIGLNAIGGNMFVLTQKTPKNDKTKVQTFFLINLAVSDLLMGIYMLLIACADIYFGEYFPMQAEEWRSGVTCKIAGTISIMSSEASVFFITLISIDRFISIKYHYSRRKLGKKSSFGMVVLLWITSFILGVIPSSLSGLNVQFYDNSHVCIGLPLSRLKEVSHSKTEITPKDCKNINDNELCFYKDLSESHFLGDVNGMYFASVLFLGLNFICYLIILLCYVQIVRTSMKSSQRAGLNPQMKEQIRLTAKVAAIVLTDFACWFPIIILGILVQAGVLTLPPSVFAWCVTFVLPINSAINPYLYTIAAVISKRRKQAQVAPANNQEINTNRSSNRRGEILQSQRTQDTELRDVSSKQQSRKDTEQCHGSGCLHHMPNVSGESYKTVDSNV